MRAVVLVCAGLLGCAALPGCAAPPPPVETGVPIAGLPPRSEPAPDEAPGPGRPPSGPPRSTVRIREAAPPESAGPPGLARQVDLELAHAPLAQAFQLLADAASFNLVMGEEVEGEVTVRFRRISVRDALRALAATHDLALAWEGNVLFVRRP